ncbi:hypothetical protein TSOC_000915 [Tetrabaena socialis]|uniref:HTH HARE-type domain-containing protein n=1 Tax=Tetrabaena socialis TaxID=47790 RepID=A0A2J8AI45_9CHLO|nr:hypothetical protein TSOC_000915 [Tetrabaena socialis]|eukprot:PNH12181.1 hypothetical protein TSOC_000915 [Tetrabaena socialis]
MNGITGASRKSGVGGRPRRGATYGEDEPDHGVGAAPITGGVFKSAAFEILKTEERLMTSGEITKLAIERKLLKCMGKTPENTMASALYTEVRKKASTTVFIKGACSCCVQALQQLLGVQQGGVGGGAAAGGGGGEEEAVVAAAAAVEGAAAAEVEDRKPPAAAGSEAC